MKFALVLLFLPALLLVNVGWSANTENSVGPRGSSSSSSSGSSPGSILQSSSGSNKAGSSTGSSVTEDSAGSSNATGAPPTLPPQVFLLSKLDYAFLIIFAIVTYILCVVIITKAAKGEAINVIPARASRRSTGGGGDADFDGTGGEGGGGGVTAVAGEVASGVAATARSAFKAVKRTIVGGADRQPMSLSFDDEFDEPPPSVPR